MNKFRFHFAIGLHAIATIILLAVLFVLPFAVGAQEGEIAPSDEVALFAIPPILLALIATNNRVTEGFKLYLASDKLPFTPPPDVRSLLVLVFSVVFGVISAAITPTALDWLGATFNPIAAVIVTGFVVSLGAGAAQMVLGLMSSLSGNQAVYKTTTTISAPPEGTSDKAAVASMAAASQAAKS